MDSLTRKWIRNRADELAVDDGARFDADRAAHVVDFFERELVLYEGDAAGEPFKLIEWQHELLSRAFGWVMYSADWGREIRRFRKVSVWVPKKNGKSPLAAGVGLYLLSADGEMGQKVYSAARDGKQAQIVHGHAKQMVKRSPVLSQMCRINNSTARITFPEADSFYALLAGDNIEGQEGLNGSVIIDETHVVDDRLAKVLEHMGASRSEPMQFECSTAGNNPDCYGKRQWDYGRQVERGDVTDHEFLFSSYGVEAGASDADCMDAATWKAANPSWGVTIKAGEFERSARRAKQKSLADWNSWKMYRLNQWQAANCPWLDQTLWNACAAELPADELVDVPAAAGLDLSKTRDMSALALAWDHDGRTWLRVWLWITEAYAEKHAAKVPFAQWAEAGALTIIPGDTIRQRWIREQFERLNEEYILDVLAYDKTYAQDFCEWVDDEFEVELIEFPQSHAAMERPVDDFLAAVRDRKLAHGSNPCLTWQAGHAETKENGRGYRLLAKPASSELKKIDGLVASVMAVWGLQHVREFAEDAFIF